MSSLNLNRIYIRNLQAVDACVNEGRPVTFCTFVFGAIFVLARPSL